MMRLMTVTMNDMTSGALGYHEGQRRIRNQACEDIRRKIWNQTALGMKAFLGISAAMTELMHVSLAERKKQFLFEWIDQTSG